MNIYKCNDINPSFPLLQFRKIISPINMYGTVLHKYPNGFLVITNECCFKSKLNFLSIDIKKYKHIEIGDQVEYIHGLVVKQQFDNCYRCHKSCEETCAQQWCECYTDDTEVLIGEAVVVSKTMKKYRNSWAWKIDMQKDDQSTLHFVIFESSPFFDLASDLFNGQVCMFKGIVKNPSDHKECDRHILLNIYHLRD